MSRTPKQRVMRRCIVAYITGSWKHGMWFVHRATHGYTDLLGTGESPRQAWVDADRRLSERNRT